MENTVRSERVSLSLYHTIVDDSILIQLLSFVHAFRDTPFFSSNLSAWDQTSSYPHACSHRIQAPYS